MPVVGICIATLTPYQSVTPCALGQTGAHLYITAKSWKWVMAIGQSYPLSLHA